MDIMVRRGMDWSDGAGRSLWLMSGPTENHMAEGVRCEAVLDRSSGECW
jgi:hypothetical protein